MKTLKRNRIDCKSRSWVNLLLVARPKRRKIKRLKRNRRDARKGTMHGSKAECRLCMIACGPTSKRTPFLYCNRMDNQRLKQHGISTTRLDLYASINEVPVIDIFANIFRSARH